jgi:ribosomal protein S27E|nr:MAG TPA: nucleic-acid-binding protein [Caudoviricetes sp.]
MENIIRCPYCHSQQLSIGEKGFSATKAILGSLLFTPIPGALAGFMGSSQTEVTCLNCGKRMKVSQLEKVAPVDKDGFEAVH